MKVDIAQSVALQKCLQISLKQLQALRQKSLRPRHQPEIIFYSLYILV